MAEYPTNRRWPYFALGIVAGATLGLLFARKTGKETREDVRDWLKTKREESKELISKIKDKFPRDEHTSHRRKEFVEA